jgi:hypothetical protein
MIKSELHPDLQGKLPQLHTMVASALKLLADPCFVEKLEQQLVVPTQRQAACHQHTTFL